MTPDGVLEALKTQITTKDVALEELKGQVAALKDSLFSATDSPQAELGRAPLALNAENDELKAQITVKDRALEELREQVVALKQSLFASTEDSHQVALGGAPLALNAGNSADLEAKDRVIEELREQVAVLKQSLFDATTDTSETTAATNPEVEELTARLAARDESVQELKRQMAVGDESVQDLQMQVEALGRDTAEWATKYKQEEVRAPYLHCIFTPYSRYCICTLFALYSHFIGTEQGTTGG